VSCLETGDVIKRQPRAVMVLPARATIFGIIFPLRHAVRKFQPSTVAPGHPNFVAKFPANRTEPNHRNCRLSGESKWRPAKLGPIENFHAAINWICKMHFCAIERSNYIRDYEFIYTKG
jgi:hypothetical protein